MLRDVGSSCSCSPEKVIACRAFCTSTTGDSALTATVSWKLPTPSAGLTLAVNPLVSTTLSRCCRWNPLKLNTTV